MGGDVVAKSTGVWESNAATRMPQPQIQNPNTKLQPRTGPEPESKTRAATKNRNGKPLTAKF